MLFIRICPICGKGIPVGQKYCSCSDKAPRVVQPDDKLIDPHDPVQLLHLCAPYYYDGLVRGQLLMLKFQHRKEFVRPLAAAMAAQVQKSFPEVSFDVVTFVPMTPEDIRIRSWNQSALLAQTIAELLFIECSALLAKTKSTPQQHTLNQSDRLQNLQNVFHATDRCVQGSTVLLVDDIKTTGTTLLRCCEALLNAGVRDVYCVCAAVSQQNTPLF